MFTSGYVNTETILHFFTVLVTHGSVKGLRLLSAFPLSLPVPIYIRGGERHNGSKKFPAHECNTMTLVSLRPGSFGSGDQHLISKP